MRAAVLIFVITALTACASTGEGSSYDPNLITLEEIQASVHDNVYEIVQERRPRWLITTASMSIRSGPGSVQFYVDGVRQGSPQSINKAIVREIRYYPPADAQARWGAGHQQGAIDVITRKLGADQTG